jgi:S-DNA-T family DNA segregation ATPase FtsK/SpoIIIE
VAPDTVSTSVTSGVDPDIKAMVDKYSEPGDDDNILKSLEILFSDRKISTSYIQRRLGIGYNKAAEIMDAFEVRGLVSAPQPGGSKRDILVFDEIENS